MSRFTDILPRSLALVEPSLLPIVDWSQVGRTAPTPVNFAYQGPTAALPKADILILTWTGAEWAAMDHVFLRSAVTEPGSARVNVSKWFLYSRQAPSSSAINPLWGYYQLVTIEGSGGASHKVLLFKSDAHLAHPPYLDGLSTELGALIDEVQPSHIYSIGTAGGASDNQRLGDVAITNGGKIQLKLQTNLQSGFDGQTFTCTDWFPPVQNLLPQVQSKLFYHLDQIVTTQELQKVLDAAKQTTKGKSLIPYSLNDLVNSALDPQNLGTPKAVAFQGTPLLTTDFYFIAEGNMNYAALEMDDAVIAEVASTRNVPFVFIRNISDTLVPLKDHQGQAIVPDARSEWSSVVYDHFGVYTSFNGALAAWATIADS